MGLAGPLMVGSGMAGCNAREHHVSKADKTAEILELPAAERLRLVEELWDSLAAEPSLVPIPDWHREELDRRLAGYDTDADSPEAWEDVKARLDAPRPKS